MKWSTWVLRNKVKVLNQASALVILDSESFNLWNEGECSKSAISSSIEKYYFLAEAKRSPNARSISFTAVAWTGWRSKGFTMPWAGVLVA